jgi:uncharacterized membrane protein YedE/YeeE
MTTFDPVSAGLGGVLIGLASSLLLLVNGRVAGVSGILGGAMAASGERIWRLAFLAGLPIGALAFSQVRGTPITIDASPTALIVAGLLVGFGTQLGSGCTSGHGVCGLARFSTRSAVATATFMGTAALVVLVRRLTGGG